MSEEMKHRGVVILSPALKVSTRALKDFREAGYIVVRGDPDQVRMVSPVADLSGDEITIAALKTCAVNDTRHKEFGKIILDSMIARIGTTP